MKDKSLFHALIWRVAGIPYNVKMVLFTLQTVYILFSFYTNILMLTIFSILINYIFKILSSTDHKKYKSNIENYLKCCVQPKARNEDRNLA